MHTAVNRGPGVVVDLALVLICACELAHHWAVGPVRKEAYEVYFNVLVVVVSISCVMCAAVKACRMRLHKTTAQSSADASAASHARTLPARVIEFLSGTFQVTTAKTSGAGLLLTQGRGWGGGGGGRSTILSDSVV